MKRKTKVKMQKAFQSTYLLMFFITSIGIATNIELDFETPTYIFILWGICGILSMAKMIYHDLKYPGAKYVWH